MKKNILLVLLISVFTVILNITAFADVKFDQTNSAKGIITINLTDYAGKVIKAQVEKGGEKYIYTLIKTPVNIPLQMGTGDYKITVLENIAGDKYKPLASESFSVAAIDEKELYKASVPIVEYSVSTKAIPAFKTLTDGKSVDADKIAAIYKEVVDNYSYDFEKVTTVKSDYVPVIDDVYTAKKGICYDYAAILGGVLRSQGIPTKLVMGYVPEISEYHAWNEILISDKWVAVDPTYDAQVVKAGLAYTMEKDKTKTKVVKTY